MKATVIKFKSHFKVTPVRVPPNSLPADIIIMPVVRIERGSDDVPTRGRQRRRRRLPSCKPSNGSAA